MARLLSSPSDFANSFNTYFANIGSDLASQIHLQHSKFDIYLKSPAAQSMSIPPTTAMEITRLAKLLNATHSCGNDGVFSQLAKKINPIHRNSSGCHNLLINYSLFSGQFPNQLKEAKVVPLYKSGKKDLLANYWPISILNYFSKFFKKVTYITAIYQNFS